MNKVENQFEQSVLNPRPNEPDEVELSLKGEGTGEKKEARIEDLAHALYLWLNYQSTVSSSINILHEASFRYPIAEYLERKSHVITILEDEHPMFKNRPIDFQWEQNGKKYYLECKYVKFGYTNTKQELQRYVDDLCRLYYCIQDEEKDICYFLVCGSKEQIDNCFFESKANGRPMGGINASRYNFLLNFKKDGVNDLEFDLIHFQEEAGMNDEQKKQICMNALYKNFKGEYKEDIKEEKRENHKIEDVIAISLTSLHEIKDDDEQYVYFWRVKKKRDEIIDHKLIAAD